MAFSFWPFCGRLESEIRCNKFISLGELNEPKSTEIWAQMEFHFYYYKKTSYTDLALRHMFFHRFSIAGFGQWYAGDDARRCQRIFSILGRSKQ